MNLYKWFYHDPKRALLPDQAKEPYMVLVSTFISQSESESEGTADKGSEGCEAWREMEERWI